MSTLRTVSCAFLAALVSLVFADSADAIKILMHGREETPIFRDDGFVFEHLELAFGADNVDYIQGSASAADGSSANGYDVLFISSTMASSNTRDKYEDSTVGIVCDEGALANDDTIGNFMLSNSSGNQDGLKIRNTINILDPTHPLAAGLSGEVTVFKLPPDGPDLNWSQFGKGELGTGVSLIADWDTTDQPDPVDPVEHAIFAADVGDALRGDGSAGSPATAAGRRVFFFMSDFGFFDMTTDGIALFDAALTWAAADPVISSGDFDGDDDVDGGDYLLWQRGLGINDGSADPIDGDANGDGNVTDADLTVWKTQFGTIGAETTVGAVPEPTSVTLVFLAAIGALAFRRKAS